MRLTLNGFSGSGKTFLKSFIIRGCLEGRDCLHRRSCGCFCLKSIVTVPKWWEVQSALVQTQYYFFFWLGIQVSIPRGPKIAGIWHICVTHGFIGTSTLGDHRKGMYRRPSKSWRAKQAKCLSRFPDLWGAKITQNLSEADKISFKTCHQWTKLQAFCRFLWTAHGGSLWTKVTNLEMPLLLPNSTEVSEG